MARLPSLLLPGAGESHWLLGDQLTFKLGPEQTGGAFTLGEALIAPGGGPPAHLHRREDELFYVLEGQFDFTVGPRVFRRSAGFTAFLPRGQVHGFKNVGTRPGRLLVMCTPCGFEKFYAEAGHHQPKPPPPTQADVMRFLAAAGRHGIELKADWKAKPFADGTASPRRDRSLWVLGEHVTPRLTSAQTNGQLSLAEVVSRPGGGAPAHCHKREDELFYVLAGTYAFEVDGRGFRAEPGAVVHVPAGAQHGFRNVAHTIGRLIDVHTPGGFEAFFEDAGAPASIGCPEFDSDFIDAPPPPEPAHVLALIRRHGMEMPLPGAARELVGCGTPPALAPTPITH